jgi:hypothetical protein
LRASSNRAASFSAVITFDKALIGMTFFVQPPRAANLKLKIEDLWISLSEA